MMIILAPIALFFLASFVLTLRWHERSGSVPGLFLGAIVQPLFSASLFAAGMVVSGTMLNGETRSSVQSLFSLTFFFTAIVAIPFALICCVEPMQRIRSRGASQRPPTGDETFIILTMAGGISFVCAVLAVGTVLFIAR